jgi:hypothetical protein
MEKNIDQRQIELLKILAKGILTLSGGLSISSGGDAVGGMISSFFSSITYGSGISL